MEFGLRGRKIAVMSGSGLSTGDLDQIIGGLSAAGAELHLVGGGDGTSGSTRAVSLDDAGPEGYAALVLAGGDSSSLTRDDKARAFVRAMMEADKPVAVLGRGAELLVAADAVRGRTLAADKSLRAAIEKAGGSWTDKSMQVDQKLVSGAGGDAVAAFSRKLTTELSNKLDSAKVDQLSQQSFPASDPPPGPASIGAATRFGGGDEARP
jgi:protease I